MPESHELKRVWSNRLRSMIRQTPGRGRGDGGGDFYLDVIGIVDYIVVLYGPRFRVVADERIAAGAVIAASVRIVRVAVAVVSYVAKLIFF